MTEEEGTRSESASSDDVNDAAKPKRRLRGMLLQYMLYDAFVRPTSWHFASLHDDERERVWRDAVTRLCSEQPGSVYVASNASELPAVPIFAASAIRDAKLPARFVHVLEPRRPIASALRSVIKDNALESSTRVLAASAGVYRPNIKAADDAPGGPARVFLVPGVEDIANLGRALEDVAEAHENLLAPGARVLPSSVTLRAVGVNVPAQTDLVRARVGVVSGFDLGAFNQFRGEAPVDLVRLRDVKYVEVTAVGELTRVSLEHPPSEEDGLRGSKLDEIELEIVAVADGELNAVALWTECDMFGEVLSSGVERLSRRQMVSFLPSPLSVLRGTTIRLKCSYDFASGSFHFTPMEVASTFATDGVSMSVERWHFPMVNDERRNAAYDDAVRRVIGGHRVVDIGGGSGLLAMMAARAGASQVATVERIGDMVECATRVLASNGFSGKIKVVHGSSLDLEPAALGFNDDARATVVLSEVLDDGLLGEGVIPTVAHARRHLADPGALVIPAAAKVWAQIVSIPTQPEPVIMPASSAVDPSGRRWGGYDTLRPPEVKRYTSVRLDRVKHVPLTEPFPVFGFDFDAPLDHPSSTAEYSRVEDINVEANADGVANAVVFWFTLTLNRGEDSDALADLCTYPAMAKLCEARGSSRCWNEALQFIEPLAVHSGCALSLRASHSPTRVSFGGLTELR